MNVIKALCFFYYLLILPCIWLGKKIWWGLFADTAGKKKSAEAAVLKAAKKKGTPEDLEKLGAVSLQKEMEKYRNLFEKWEREDKEAEEERNKAEQQKRAERAKQIAEREERLGIVTGNQEYQGLSLREEVESHHIGHSHNIPRGSRQSESSPTQEAAVDLEFYNDTLWADLEEMPDLLDTEMAAVGSSGDQTTLTQRTKGHQ